MKKNVPVQAYLPPHLASWLESEARRAQVSRSQWIASVMLDLFQGHDIREDARAAADQMQRQLSYLICAVDGLLSAHPDPSLRSKVSQAFNSNNEAVHREVGQ